MKRIIQCLTALLVAASFSSSADAMPMLDTGLVASMNTSSPRTVTVSNIDPGSVSGSGVITLTGIGDFDNAGESFQVDFTGGAPGSDLSFDVTGTGSNTLVRSFNVTQSQLANLFANDSVNVKFTASSQVNVSPFSQRPHFQAVIASVPEPASLALLAIGGLVGGGAYRRRRSIATA